MNFKHRVLLLAPCLLALVAATGTASAVTINASVWENQPAYPASLNPAAPSTTADATYTVNDINFLSTTANYTIGGFIGSDPLANPVTLTGASKAADTLNNTTWEFTGSNFLTSGTTYTVNHDDGIFLFLVGVNGFTGSNGSSANCVICSGTPTDSIPSTFSVASSGTYSYELLYAEVNGAPAVLDAPFASTPEPSTFILLGSGLLGAAGAIRRRMKS